MPQRLSAGCNHSQPRNGMMQGQPVGPRTDRPSPPVYAGARYAAFTTASSGSTTSCHLVTAQPTAANDPKAMASSHPLT